MIIHDRVLLKACDFLEEHKRRPTRVFLGVVEMQEVLRNYHLIGSIDDLPTNKYMGMEVTLMPTGSCLEVGF